MPLPAGQIDDEFAPRPDRRVLRDVPGDRKPLEHSSHPDESRYSACMTVEAGHQQWAEETQSSVSGSEVAVEPVASPDDVALSGLMAVGRDPAQRTPTLVD